MHRIHVDCTVDLSSHESLRELEEFIEHRLSGRVRDLHVSLCECGLVLRGQAHTYYATQLEQHIAMEIIAVPICANEIVVS